MAITNEREEAFYVDSEFYRKGIKDREKSCMRGEEEYKRRCRL
jgi:hypothetical protein